MVFRDCRISISKGVISGVEVVFVASKTVFKEERGVVF